MSSELSQAEQVMAERKAQANQRVLRSATKAQEQEKQACRAAWWCDGQDNWAVYCRHKEFTVVPSMHTLGEVRWQCTKCHQVSFASDTLPPCWFCGKHRYYVSHGNRRVCCTECSKWAIDAQGEWAFS